MKPENKHIESRVAFVAKHYTPHAFDSQKAWERFSASVPQLGKAKRARLFPRIAAAAAVAVVLVGIGILLMRPQSQSQTLAAKTRNERFTLPDNSLIDMQQGAELKYGKDFGKTERRVSMTGEILFAVARDEGKPFIVSTPAAQIQVLGTEFTVVADEAETQLNVKSGKVRFTPQSPAIPLLCTAGMRVHYTAATENIRITSPESAMEINGKNQSLAFHNAQLKDVALVLSHFYNVEIELPETEAALTFTSSFAEKSVIEIINIINLTLDTHLTINN